MKLLSSLERFIQLLEQQTVLFKKLLGHQKIVQQALLERSFSDLEGELESMTELANKIHHAEQDRDFSYGEILQELQMPNDSLMSSLIENLSNKEYKTRLAEAYRNFKISVLSTRSYNEGITAYSASQLIVMEEVMDTAYPQRKSTTYNAGGQRQRTNEPLVIDRHL